MILYRILSEGCSLCLVVKEMTRRILPEFPQITPIDVDVDLEREKAQELILPGDPALQNLPGLPIPYLRLGNAGLYSPQKMQEIRDFFNAALKEEHYESERS